MNPQFALRNIPLLLGFSCVALFLTGVGVTTACSQVTNSPAAAPDSVTEVSRYPQLSQLPGKVPPGMWSGLPDAWAHDHARWKATAGNDACSVVFLGDSITERWRTLAKDFPKLKVANRGIGGDNTCGVLYRLKADVLSLKPAAIVLLIGTNDIGFGADADDVAANIRLILSAIRNYDPHLKVIVCKVMPRSERDGPIYANKIERVNFLLEQYVKGQPPFTLCDTWQIFAKEKGNPNPRDFDPDHLHLNAAGYADWKKALTPLIADLHLETGHDAR